MWCSVWWVIGFGTELEREKFVSGGLPKRMVRKSGRKGDITCVRCALLQISKWIEGCTCNCFCRLIKDGVQDWCCWFNLGKGVRFQRVGISN